MQTNSLPLLFRFLHNFLKKIPQVRSQTWPLSAAKLLSWALKKMLPPKITKKNLRPVWWTVLMMHTKFKLHLTFEIERNLLIRQSELIIPYPRANTLDIFILNWFLKIWTARIFFFKCRRLKHRKIVERCLSEFVLPLHNLQLCHYRRKTR